MRQKYYPPPPTFIGGAGPYLPRKLNPVLIGVPADPPPLGRPRALASMALVLSRWQPVAPVQQVRRCVVQEGPAASTDDWVDDFDRAGPDPGAGWETVLGSPWVIDSSLYLKPAATYQSTAVRRVGTYPNDQSCAVWVEVARDTGDVGQQGPAVRMDGSGNCYRALLDKTSIAIYKRVGGVDTYLGDWAISARTIGVLYLVRLLVTNTTIEVFLDGPSQGLVSDADLTSGNPGLYAQTGEAPLPRFDVSSGTADSVSAGDPDLVAIGGTAYATIQEAYDAAVAGDVIKCLAGHVFTENLVLDRAFASDVYITTTTPPEFLPAPGVRTSPAYAWAMPTIQSVGFGATCVQIEINSSHVKFQHVHFPEVPHGYNAIITIGHGDSVQEFESQEPTYVTVDQCYIHGGAVCGQKRGVETHGKYLTITNNYFDDIFGVGQDSNCVGGFNGHGPLVVTNNRLCGGTEPFMVGGGDPSVRTYMTVTGGASTTGADVACSEAGHTLSELFVGQGLAVKVGGSFKFTTIVSITGTGATGSLTWVATGTPDNPGDVRAGVVMGAHGSGTGLTFEHNLVEQKAQWAKHILPAPTGVTATPSTASGSLAPGNYYYTRQSFSTDGYQESVCVSEESTEVLATLPGTGEIVIAGSAAAGATSDRIWRGTSAGSRTEYRTVSPGLAFIDDGTVSWTSATPGSATRPQIKNLFEIKACQHYSVKGNIFRWHVHTVDVGYAMWLKTANQDGEAPYLQTRDGVVELNVLQHVDGILEVNGREEGSSNPNKMPGVLTNLIFRNNLAIHSGYRNDGYAYTVQNGAADVTIDHITGLHNDSGGGGGLLTLDSGGLPLVDFVFTNLLGRKGTYGVHDPTGEGLVALAAAAPGYVFTKNAIADAASGTYGSANFFDANVDWEAQFVAYVEDGTGADFHLVGGSPWRNAGLDGEDLGADIDAVLAETADVETSWTGAPPPPPPPPIGFQVSWARGANEWICEGGSPVKKNVSGQTIGMQMVSVADGSAFTGAVTVLVTGDAGAQATGSVGGGACTHEGNGYHTYAPSQAETNYDLIAFTFTGAGAVPSTVQVYTSVTE